MKMHIILLLIKKIYVYVHMYSFPTQYFSTYPRSIAGPPLMIHCLTQHTEPKSTLDSLQSIQSSEKRRAGIKGEEKKKHLCSDIVKNSTCAET